MMPITQDHWFYQAKFGLFIHWGLYAILAGEYEGRKTHHIAEWIMHDLNIPKEDYEQLAGQFHPTLFDADALVRLALDAGMKYVCLTAKHHDGFSLFDTQADPYNVVKASPYGQDICKQVQLACQKYGLKLCFYYSQAQDWHHPGGLEVGIKPTNPGFMDYFHNKVVPQVTELLTNYGKVGMLWFDTPLGMDEGSARQLRELVKNLQPDCLISGRIGHGLADYMTTGDNFIPLLPPGFPFEVPATLNNTWGYNKDDQDWKPASRVIKDLVHIISRSGNYLLNVGPDGEGRVPTASADILLEVGKYLAKNGEGIYGTGPVPPYPYDLPWLGMTQKPHTLYLHVFDDRQAVYLINIGNTLRRVSLLADGRELDFVQGKTCEGDGYFTIRLPEDLPAGPAVVIKCELVEEKVMFEGLRI